MYNFYSYFLICLFFSGIIVYAYKYKHLLLMLLSLEICVVGLFGLMLMYFTHYYNEFFLSMVYLTMSVCEGALGLSLLVFVVRTFGNDKIMSFDNLW
uniref:NADH-ubiquinone oxidoreductase chain 4L n=1 Tax=Alcidodes juglans TaxID=2530216 RepID=A0A482DS46_9CUCU|nr:NADH dehydrogenase subunit 4L [Alcidodes juglans]QBM10387.1 NADH dehydrogenase subunit 4L [Alcidodes juglans]